MTTISSSRAESEAEATAKLLNLRGKESPRRAGIRPATEDANPKRFEEEQYQAYRDSESAASIARDFQRDIQQREPGK